MKININSYGNGSLLGHVMDGSSNLDKESIKDFCSNIESVEINSHCFETYYEFIKSLWSELEIIFKSSNNRTSQNITLFLGGKFLNNFNQYSYG